MKKALPAASFYSRIREILESARTSIARSVNTTQVVANWLIGREIVEEQQRGQKRAAYGERLLADLSTRLQADYGKGFSIKNLEYFRDFYLTYAGLLAVPIPHALRAEFISTTDTQISMPARRRAEAVLPSFLTDIGNAAPSQPWQPGRLHSNLSWTHYRTLLRVDSPGARDFYEIEAIANHWSARELERQINSLLFERLALSKDKKGVMRLGTKGQEIARPIDVFKDPVVIEFLGLPESPRLAESDLEAALLDTSTPSPAASACGKPTSNRPERGPSSDTGSTVADCPRSRHLTGAGSSAVARRRGRGRRGAGRCPNGPDS